MTENIRSQIEPWLKPAISLTRQINETVTIPVISRTEAFKALSEKDPSSAFFYVASFDTANQAVERPINLTNIINFSGIIITIDELVENTKLSPNEISLYLPSLFEHFQYYPDPQSKCSLKLMLDAMTMERYGKFKNFESYLKTVSISFGLMPLWLEVAHQYGESRVVASSEHMDSLRNLEIACRILADIITLPKDLGTNSKNVVTEYTRLNQGNNTSSTESLKQRALNLITKVAHEYEQSALSCPDTIKFALKYAEVLKNVDGDDNTIRNPLLTLIGSLLKSGKQLALRG